MPEHPDTVPSAVATGITEIHVTKGNVAATVEMLAPELLGAVRETGAALVRGFDALSVTDFEAVTNVVLENVVSGNGEHESVDASRVVQTPVTFSPDRKLLWHNENSFNRRWPLTLLFSPTVVATVGGRTPITDSRQLLKVLDPAIVARFRDRGVAYIRRFGNGIGQSWQKVFGADSRSEVEASAAVDGIELTWVSERSEQSLSTRTVRPAVVAHPLTDEHTWFAQPAHWHPACLDDETREALVDVLGPNRLPRDCQFGDGSVIPDSMMHEVIAAHESIERSFDWVAGDILVIDNVLTAHARDPYIGPRRLLVAMGDEHEFAERVGPKTLNTSR